MVRGHVSRFDSLIIIILAVLTSVFYALLSVSGDKSSIVIGALLTGAIVISLLIAKPASSLYIYLIAWPVYPVINMVVLAGSMDNIRLWQETLLAVTLMALVLKTVVRKKKAIQITNVDRAVLILCLMSVYGSMLARQMDQILYGFHLTYTPMLMYFLVRMLDMDYLRSVRWIKALLWVSGLIAIIGIYIQFTDPAFYYHKLVAPENIDALARLGRWRMGSVFGNPLYFGILMAIVGILALHMFLTEHKWYWFTMFWIFCTCAWWSVTRGAWMMLFIGVALILLDTLKGVWRSLLILGIVSSLVVVVAGALLPNSPLNITYYLSDSSGLLLASRQSQWQMAWTAIVEAPFGHGLGVGHASLRSTSADSVNIYDGWYLKVLAEGGFLGIIVFIGFLATTVSGLASEGRRQTDARIARLSKAVLAVFVSFSAAAIASNVWDYYMIAPVIWVLLAIAVTLNQKVKVPHNDVKRDSKNTITLRAI